MHSCDILYICKSCDLVTISSFLSKLLLDLLDKLFSFEKCFLPTLSGRRLKGLDDQTIKAPIKKPTSTLKKQLKKQAHDQLSQMAISSHRLNYDCLLQKQPK